MDTRSSQVLISSVEGNTQRLDGGAMFGNAPRQVWEKWCKPDDFGRIELHCRSLLIEYAGKTILCETGIGAFFEPKLAERYGVVESEHMLLKHLTAAGLSDASIDYIILSHLHFDHAGGLLPPYNPHVAAGDYELLFPRATYLVGKTAFERAIHPHPRDRASFIPGLAEKLAASGRLQIVEGEKAKGVFEDRLSFIYTDGHTPGQMHAVFRGEHTSIVFAGDLIPGTAWVHLPITMGYDRFAEMVIDEKADLYKMSVPQHWLLFYTHDALSACSYVIKDDKGKFVPNGAMATLKKFAL